MIFGSGRRARDEWEWGPPNSDPGSGDPSRAFSGDYVMGNDLGLGEFAFGTYQRNKIEELVSPEIDVSAHQNVRLQYRRWLTIEDGDFDQGEILIGDARLWSNLASGTGGVHHVDKEWRFHDVDISQAAAQSGGRVKIIYRLTSDDGLQLGGWTIDDFCLVGFEGPKAACGDGKIDFGEACDDGNTTSGDGCEATCVVTTPPMCPGDPSCEMEMPEPESPMLEKEDAGCSCSARERNSGSGWLALIALLALVLVRRSRL
jgi:MYXO-CTERM domain-containing protein